MNDTERIKLLEQKIRELEKEIALIKRWGNFKPTRVVGKSLDGKPLIVRDNGQD